MCKKLSDEHPENLWGTFSKNKKTRDFPFVKRPGGEAKITRIWPSLRMSGVTPPHPHIVMAHKGNTSN